MQRKKARKAGGWGSEIKGWDTQKGGDHTPLHTVLFKSIENDVKDFDYVSELRSQHGFHLATSYCKIEVFSWTVRCKLTELLYVESEIVCAWKFIRISTGTPTNHLAENDSERKDVGFLRAWVIVEELRCNMVRRT